MPAGARAGRAPVTLAISLPLIAAAGGAVAGRVVHERQCPHPGDRLQFLTTEQFNRQHNAGCFGR